jgi:hypothetical protein
MFLVLTWIYNTLKNYNVLELHGPHELIYDDDDDGDDLCDGNIQNTELHGYRRHLPQGKVAGTRT